MNFEKKLSRVRGVHSVRSGNKHSLSLISQVEFAALEIRKTKPLTFILGSTDMNVILRITWNPNLLM